MKKTLLTLFITFILSISAFAQLEVKEGSFKEVEGFVNINTDIMYDDNDKPYAVLKVKTENINDKERRQLLFQGDARTFFELEYKVGEVWVYISYYATYLKVSHPDFGSTEFWFPFDMKPKKGYELILFKKPSVDEDFQKRLERLESELNKQQKQSLNENTEAKEADKTYYAVERKKKQHTKSLRHKGLVFRPEIGVGLMPKGLFHDVPAYIYSYIVHVWYHDYDKGIYVVLNANVGYQINPFVYLGFGVGADLKTSSSMMSLPIYLNPRFYVNDSKTSLFFDIKLGYAASLKSSEAIVDDFYCVVDDVNASNVTTATKFDGFIGEFGVGLEYKYSSFGVSVGYQHFNSEINIKNFHDNYSYYPICVMLKYGYTIFLNKK